MRKLLTKLSSMLVAVAMVIGMMPATALAATAKTYTLTLELSTDETGIESKLEEGGAYTNNSVEYSVSSVDGTTIVLTVSRTSPPTFVSSEDVVSELWDLSNYTLDSYTFEKTAGYGSSTTTNGVLTAQKVGNSNSSTATYCTLTCTVELTANVTNYTVTFVSDDVETSSTSVEAGGTITLEALTRDGYAFAGWTDGTNTYAAGETITITSDMTLTAVWNKYTQTVQVSANVVLTSKVSVDDTNGDWVVTDVTNGVITYKTTSTSSKTDFTIPFASSLWELGDYEYVSLEWTGSASYSGSEGSLTEGSVVSVSKAGNNPKTIEYTLAIPATTYTVKFVQDEGSETVLYTTTVEEGTTIYSTTYQGDDPTKDGYVFKRWVIRTGENTTRALTETSGYEVTADTEVYATWTAIKTYTVTANVTVYDADGNALDATLTSLLKDGGTTEDGWTISVGTNSIVFTKASSSIPTFDYEDEASDLWDLSSYDVASETFTTSGSGTRSNGTYTFSSSAKNTTFTFNYIVTLEAEDDDDTDDDDETDDNEAPFGQDGFGEDEDPENGQDPEGESGDPENDGREDDDQPGENDELKDSIPEINLDLNDRRMEIGGIVYYFEEDDDEEESSGGTIGSGALALVNVDAETGAYLDGATYALFRSSNNNLVGVYTADERGWISTYALSYDTYYFVQVEAAEGYVLDQMPIYVTLTKTLSYSPEYPWVIKAESAAADAAAVVEAEDAEMTEAEETAE